jgi:hypothetical protein
MNAHSESVRAHSLVRGELLRPGLAGLCRICVDAGELWLTRRGDPTDVFLRSGETLTVDAADDWVLQATRPSRIHIHPERVARPCRSLFSDVTNAAFGATRKISVFLTTALR